MSRQFKPGDLALVVASIFPENIGRVVELISWHPAGDLHVITPDGQRFENDDGLDAWVIKGELVTKFRGIEGECFGCQYAITASRKLMPLRGNFAPEQTKSREVSA